MTLLLLNQLQLKNQLLLLKLQLLLLSLLQLRLNLKHKNSNNIRVTPIGATLFAFARSTQAPTPRSEGESLVEAICLQPRITEPGKPRRGKISITSNQRTAQAS